MSSCNGMQPRPPPRFYLAAVEKNRHGCEIKSGQRPGNEANATYTQVYTLLAGHVL